MKHYWIWVNGYRKTRKVRLIKFMGSQNEINEAKAYVADKPGFDLFDLTHARINPDLQSFFHWASQSVNTFSPLGIGFLP